MTRGSGEVNPLDKVRFSRWVGSALGRARARGLTDDDIADLTGVGASTFHRWRRGEFTRAPELARIRHFCKGLGENLDDALTALGMRPGRDNPEPEPPLPREVKIILRALGDPNKPDAEKVVIREMLLMLAARAEATEPRRRPPRRRRGEEEAS